MNTSPSFPDIRSTLFYADLTWRSYRADIIFSQIIIHLLLVQYKHSENWRDWGFSKSNNKGVRRLKQEVCELKPWTFGNGDFKTVGVLKKRGELKTVRNKQSIKLVLDITIFLITTYRNATE